MSTRHFPRVTAGGTGPCFSASNPPVFVTCLCNPVTPRDRVRPAGHILGAPPAAATFINIFCRKSLNIFYKLENQQEFANVSPDNSTSRCWMYPMLNGWCWCEIRIRQWMHLHHHNGRSRHNGPGGNISGQLHHCQGIQETIPIFCSYCPDAVHLLIHSYNKQNKICSKVNF